MESKKLVCVGDGATGKTSLLIAYIHNNFAMDYIPTYIDISEVTVWNVDTRYKLSMWDTAGGGDYDTLRPLSYPQTDVFIITFSCVSPASYEHARVKWFPEISHYCPNTPFFIVATKLDLRDDPATIAMLAEKKLAPITREQGLTLARELGGRYFETSALTGKGVRTLFETAVTISELPLLPRKKNYYDMYTKNEKKCFIS